MSPWNSDWTVFPTKILPKYQSSTGNYYLKIWDYVNKFKQTDFKVELFTCLSIQQIFFWAPGICM